MSKKRESIKPEELERQEREKQAIEKSTSEGKDLHGQSEPTPDPRPLDTYDLEPDEED